MKHIGSIWNFLKCRMNLITYKASFVDIKDLNFYFYYYLHLYK